jgi:hypothetical protein
VGQISIGNLGQFIIGTDSPNDPLAQALTYTEDASTSTAATHAPGSACANCNFFQSGGGAFGACQLFQGKTVNAKGWCAGYVKKS